MISILLDKRKNVDLSISMARIFAMCMIIICHFLQYYGSPLAMWFNVGVQVFLVISGYLYASKINSDINYLSFYFRNFKKILIDYWIFLAIMIILYWSILEYKFSATQLIKLCCGLPSGISGLGHLWFVSTILLCYLITPFLEKIANYKKYIFIVLFAIEIIFHFVPNITGAWMNCYVIGFILAKMKDVTNKIIADRKRRIICVWGGGINSSDCKRYTCLYNRR